MVSALIVIPLMLLGQSNDQPIGDEIRAKSNPPRTLAFAFSGRTRWVADPKVQPKPPGYETFGDEFEGTLFARGDLSAVALEVYRRLSQSENPVLLTKAALLDGKKAEFGPVGDRFSIKPGVALRLPGDIDGLVPMSSPAQLFPAWKLGKELRDKNRRIVAEGQEQIDGRNCTRVRVEPKKGPNPNPSCQRFWVDLDRGAQVLQYEMVNDSKVWFRIDGIKLVPIPRPGGADYWMPMSSRLGTFSIGSQPAPEPLIEHTVDVVEGSVRLDLDLPDATFGDVGDTAAVSGGEAVEAASRAGALRKAFDSKGGSPSGQVETPQPQPQRKPKVSRKRNPR